MLIFSVFFFSLWAALPFLLRGPPSPGPEWTESADLLVVKTYRVTIKPIDPALKSFRVREDLVTFSDWTGEHTLRLEKEVASQRVGFALREVRIAPLNADSQGRVYLGFAGISARICARFGGKDCPQSRLVVDPRIELRDFPINSFYDAKNAEAEERDTYINTETIYLSSVRTLEEGIVFAYVPSPYYYLRPVLKPFVGLSSFGELVITSLGLIGGLIGAVFVTPIVRPVLSDLVKERLKSWFKKAPQKKPGKKVPLIISGKGEEEEVEITE